MLILFTINLVNINQFDQHSSHNYILSWWKEYISESTSQALRARLDAQQVYLALLLLSYAKANLSHHGAWQGTTCLRKLRLADLTVHATSIDFKNIRFKEKVLKILGPKCQPTMPMCKWSKCGPAHKTMLILMALFVCFSYNSYFSTCFFNEANGANTPCSLPRATCLACRPTRANLALLARQGFSSWERQAC